MDNIELLEFCFENLEDFTDEYYSKKTNSILSLDPENPNNLMKQNQFLIDNITVYQIWIETNNESMQQSAIENIINALETKWINFSEFTNYWSRKDISYSIYKKVLTTTELKIDFLTQILPKYIQDRHNLYKLYWYSPSSLQAINDSKAHKENWWTWIWKLKNILIRFWLQHFSDNDLEKFENSNNIFIFPDIKSWNWKLLFQKILEKNKINFDWSKYHENKYPDLLMKIDDELYILEHKHIKESWWGQDKQMSEIISFLSYNDKNVSYISFLDWIYFNILAKSKSTTSKQFHQIQGIKNNLQKNKQNYFVNTKGFELLLSNLLNP